MRESLLWFAYFFFSLLFKLSSGFILSFVEERREKREGGGEMETGFISAREREREYSVFHFCHCHHTVDGRSLTAKDFDSIVLFFPLLKTVLALAFCNLQPHLHIRRFCRCNEARSSDGGKWSSFFPHPEGKWGKIFTLYPENNLVSCAQLGEKYE